MKFHFRLRLKILQVMSRENKEDHLVSAKQVPQPERVTTPLFPHQKANIYSMEALEERKKSILPSGDVLEANIGILGDPPGTGKTKTILGLITRNKMPWDLVLTDVLRQKCSNLEGSIRIMRTITLSAFQTNLIITPLSILTQWETEIKDTDLSYLMIRTRADIKNLEQYEVVICASTMYASIAGLYQDCCFKRLIYDEMDSCYIPNMPEVNAGFYWFISATFEETIKRINRSRTIHFMKRLFMNIISIEYAASDVMAAISVISSQALRDMRPVPSEHKTIYYGARRAPVVNHLGHYLDANAIQMIDAGNIKEAIQHLGGTEQDVNLADLVRSRAAKAVRDAEAKIREYATKPRQLAEWRKRLSDAQHSLSDIENRIKNIEIENCGLCREEMKHPVLMHCCQQTCCVRCIVRWLHPLPEKTCPFCRHVKPEFVHMKAYSPSDEKEPKDDDKKIVIGDDKFENLVRIVEKGGKVLLFSSHDNQFTQISATLKAHDISFVFLVGAATRRSNLLKSFVEGDVQVLILNSRSNGAGLNLQITTDIVVWHTMPPSLMRQVIGRACRYGLTHGVTVHKFFSEDQELPIDDEE